MKRSNALFLTMVEQGYHLFIDTKLLLCILISASVGIMNGCERDIEDLSKQDLVICWVNIDDSTLEVAQPTNLTAELIYNGKDRELRYKWSVKAGEIYNNGKRATYVAPKKAGTYIIRFEACNGPVTASETVSVNVVDPLGIGEQDGNKSQDPAQPGNTEDQKAGTDAAENENDTSAQPVPGNTDEVQPGNAENQDADKPANAGDAAPEEGNDN